MPKQPTCDHPRPQGEQPLGLDTETAEHIATLFKALSDPTRVRLIAALEDGEHCVYDLAALLEMTHSAISHQLRTLRTLHIVRARKDGRHVFYALDDEHIRTLFTQGLAHAQHT